MPTIVVAAASFDDMVAITGYTIFINIAVQGTSNQAWHIAQVLPRLCAQLEVDIFFLHCPCELVVKRFHLTAGSTVGGVWRNAGPGGSIYLLGHNYLEHQVQARWRTCPWRYVLYMRAARAGPAFTAWR